MSFAEDLKNAITSTWRDWTTAGVPASGEHDPVKSEIRSVLSSLADLALNAGTTKVVATVAQLATLPGPHEVGDRAEVRDDPLGDVPNGNGVWGWTGAAWTWISDLFPQAALDAIDEVEAAGIAALAALPASVLAPVTITTPNANTWNCANVAPYTSGADKVVLGLAASSNTGAMTINIPGVGAKSFVMPNRDPIPRRHFQLNDVFAAKYVAALDVVVLLWGPAPLPAILATVPNVASAAAHLKADIAFAGTRIAPASDATLFALQTVEIVATHDKGYGNVSVSLYALDGVTLIKTGVLRQSATNTATLSEAGAYRAGDILKIRWLATGEPYLLSTSNPLLGRAVKALAATSEPGQLANSGNGVQVRRVDDITWFIDVYPHDNHYTGAQKRNRGSDYARFILINMGPFMALSMAAPALNGYWAKFKRQIATFCNLMFDDVPTGTFPETGVSPSTVEPIFYSKKVGGVPVAIACGLGHGGLIPESWKMTGSKSDPGTGNLPPFNSGVTAATKSNPLTVTIPGANYVVGRQFTLQGITGMTQLNGVPLTVSAVGPGDVYTINGVDSTGWGVFTGHTAGNYVEKDTVNLQDLAIGPVYSGDRVVSVFTGFTGTQATPVNGEKTSRYTYTLTFESHADYQCKVLVRYDPTDPGVNTQLATVDGNMAFLLPVRDADECAGYLNGAPVLAAVSGTHVFPVNQGDNAQRVIGKVDEVRMWWTGEKTSQIRVRNRAGAPDGGSATGYSHRENGVKIARAWNTFVSTFVDYNKIYGDPIRVAPGEQDVHLIVFEFESDITMISADAVI